MVENSRDYGSNTNGSFQLQSTFLTTKGARFALVSGLAVLACSAVVWNSVTTSDSIVTVLANSPPPQQWFQNFDRMLNHPPKVKIDHFLPKVVCVVC
jgi:hypothetical protein